MTLVDMPTASAATAPLIRLLIATVSASVASRSLASSPTSRNNEMGSVGRKMQG